MTDLADQLRGYLSGLELFHQAAAARRNVYVGSGEKHSALRGELGDFRLMRGIGRGGMGTMYEAVQISLGRRVAIKVLPFSAAIDESNRVPSRPGRQL